MKLYLLLWLIFTFALLMLQIENIYLYLLLLIIHRAKTLKNLIKKFKADLVKCICSPKLWWKELRLLVLEIFTKFGQSRKNIDWEKIFKFLESYYIFKHFLKIINCLCQIHWGALFTVHTKGKKIILRTLPCLLTIPHPSWQDWVILKTTESVQSSS